MPLAHHPIKFSSSSSSYPVTTPLTKLNPRLPTTPAIRAARHGESILSINGSPLVVVGGGSSTLAKASLASSEPSVTLELPEGEEEEEWWW